VKPSLAELQSVCPQLDPRLLQVHLERLDDRYFNRFDLKTITSHVNALARLSAENPVEVLFNLTGGKEVECTILAFDYVSEFSLITGIMASMGFIIRSGGVHTYSRADKDVSHSRTARSRYHRHSVVLDPVKRRRIIDHFYGRLDTDLPLEIWINKFKEKLSGIIGLLESNQEEAVAEAKHRVNEMVARHLENLHIHSQPMLYPVQISIDNECGPFTRLQVVSEDTPVFLYALSNALSLRNVIIEHIRINTIGNRIEDLIDIYDSRGRKIQDPVMLDQIKLSVLLTKQFTYFLGQAPDPFAALSRFEQLVEDLLELPERGQWMELLSNPRILQDLARLLGASDFLWEDIIRQQYETLLPMLSPHVEGRCFSESLATLPERLISALAGAKNLEEQRQRLNEFKDREIFLFDLDHILTPEVDFRTLGEYLTYLAELVVNQAVRLNYEHLIKRYGRPRTVAGLEAKFAILGLGKFGGAALGYASDIELLFVYSDNGKTDGENSIENMEFFNKLIQASTNFIQAKREGIFNIDLRLRPFGTDGPLACSLENFCNYYGPEGKAHALERLALVRLRAVGGDAELGAQIERLRDEFIYFSKSLNIKDLRDLRLKQFAEKKQPGKVNAKFSPGALVDLEYDVQILQVMYGKDYPQLRTPRIHQALKGLKEAGVLQGREYEELVSAYDFFRQLINGLRMLRGSAQDLFLPPLESDEYRHLARRLGYSQAAGLDPAQQLYLEFETRTAVVRAFVERHFGRDSLPGPDTGNVADLILSDTISPELQNKILTQAGFKNTERAFINLRRLAGDAGQREQFARLAVLACDSLRQKPDPDMALNNWEHFVSVLPDPKAHFEKLQSQPMRLEILLNIFSASQFLSDTLVRNPEFLEWTTDPGNLHRLRDCQAYAHELQEMKKIFPRLADWMNALRRYRRREFLRIGTRDIVLHMSLPEITRDLSNLSEALIQTVLERAWEQLRLAGKISSTEWEDAERHFCILAFGKLGGRELNYSSDVDLVGFCDDQVTARRSQTAQDSGHDPYALAMESIRAYLSQYTEEGYVYRVDLRLRPYGIEGQLIPSTTSLLHYYQKSAALGEIQALLKMRPVAGNLQLGYEFLDMIRPLLVEKRDPRWIVQSVEKMRSRAMRPGNRSHPVMDVKSGLGGLRDIEFMVQGLQLIYAPERPTLLHGNTLEALRALKEEGIIDEKLTMQLSEDYIFIRRVEHYLQLLEDQQIHALPQDKAELSALAKRMSGPDCQVDQFLKDINHRLKRVRDAYLTFFIKKYS